MSQPAGERVVHLDRVEPYEPGRFFRRELPCLLAALPPGLGSDDVVVVDGYVWLAGEDTPGLGAHLYESLGRRPAVVGVARTRFAGAAAARPVYRGASRQPLFVTAAGMDVEAAANRVRDMAGPFRIPTALRRADQLARTAGLRPQQGVTALPRRAWTSRQRRRRRPSVFPAGNKR